ncbi:AI-2E family transporter [Ectothiorhodospiraceae bacterium 2226]|nr:AI-2E family transporter [Ectothiorhodospiraceae bacterium 2226]
MEVARRWFRRRFSDPQAVILAFLLVIGFAAILLFGRILAPVLWAIVIAYLLEGLVVFLERRGVPRTPAVLIVFLLFMAFLLVLVFGVVPLLWVQMMDLVRDLPAFIAMGQQVLLQLPERYPFITEAQVQEVLAAIRSQVGALGQRMLALSLASILNFITIIVYLILVPLLVFFFLKDKRLILGWVRGYLPRERALAARVWDEVNRQIGNYVRGKFWEILIVAAVSYLVFALMGLQYAMLLGALVGLSVIIPYIGAAVVTLPVFMIGYFQWGWGPELAWLMVAYAVIQALDGNVLAPLLFSRVVNLHPVAIIVAVVGFGGIWGFWGVFFAIPLATLVSAVLSAWPTTPEPAATAPPSAPARARTPEIERETPS